MFKTLTKQIYAKKETTWGTFLDPVPNDMVDARLMNIENGIETETTDTSFLTGTFAKSWNLVGKRSGTISADLMLAPATSGFGIEGGVLWNACGVAVSGPVNLNDYLIYPDIAFSSNGLSMSVMVKNQTTSPVSAQVYDYNGCMGNATISVDGVGTPLTTSFEFQGGSQNARNIPDASGIAYNFDPANVPTNLPIKFMNWTVELEAKDGSPATPFSLCTTGWEFDLGNEINSVDCQDSTSGVRGYLITDSVPTFSFNPLRTNDYIEFFNALKKEKAWTITIKPSDTTIKWKLVIQNAQIDGLTEEDDNTIIRDSVSFKVMGNWDKTQPTDYDDVAFTLADPALWQASWYITTTATA